MLAAVVGCQQRNPRTVRIRTRVEPAVVQTKIEALPSSFWTVRVLASTPPAVSPAEARVGYRPLHASVPLAPRAAAVPGAVLRRVRRPRTAVLLTSVAASVTKAEQIGRPVGHLGTTLVGTDLVLVLSPRSRPGRSPPTLRRRLRVVIVV